MTMSTEVAYWLSVGLLAAGGLVVLYALLFDWFAQRVRKRRRCPKCWYDLSHTPGLRCSECGYTAKRERKLFKAKRRWLVATLGVLILLGSYAARVTPDVQDRGWPAAVPMSAKIVLLPVLRPNHQNVTTYFNGAWVNSTTPGFNDLGVQDRLILGLLDDWRHHARNNSLRSVHTRLQRMVAPRQLVTHPHATIEWSSSVHLALASTRWNDRTPEDWESITPDAPLEIRATTRTEWPLGVPLRVWIEIDAPQEQWPSALVIQTVCGTHVRQFFTWNFFPPRSGRGVNDQSIELWAIEEVERDLDIVVSAVHEQSRRFLDTNPNPIRRRILWPKQPLPIDVRMVDNIDEILEPVEDHEFAMLLRELSEPELALGMLSNIPFGGSPYGGTLQLRVGGYRSESDPMARRHELAPYLRQFTFAAVLEIRSDGKTIGNGRFWLSHDSPYRPLKHHPYGRRGIRYEAHELLGFMFIPFELDPEWRMTNENRDASWSLVLRGDSETALRNTMSNRYWSGEIELPLTMKGSWFVMPD